MFIMGTPYTSYDSNTNLEVRVGILQLRLERQESNPGPQIGHLFEKFRTLGSRLSNKFVRIFDGSFGAETDHGPSVDVVFGESGETLKLSLAIKLPLALA